MRAKQNKIRNGIVSTPATVPIATAGEVLDGAMIELIRDDATDRPCLLLWDGRKETFGSIVAQGGRLYEPVSIKPSLLREVTLPTRSCPHPSTRKLLSEIRKLIANFVKLSEKSAALVGRMVLISWLLEAFDSAPALVINGPDVDSGNRLLQLLHCLCRHSLRLAGVTPAGLCSLPSGAQFTLLLSQSTISDRLERLLHDASRRDQKIPLRGALLDLFGVQVIRSESTLCSGYWPLRSVQIPMLPRSKELAILDASVQAQIVADFQPKLLSFRRANLRKACELQFDASKLTFSMRGLAHSLAAATPDDAGLQAEVLGLLQEEDAEIRSANWVGLETVAIEAILFHSRESPGGAFYVAQVAETAQEILSRRGVKIEVDAGAFGKTLKILGFVTEPRDARGVKLRMSEAACQLAHQLAKNFELPEVEGGEAAGGAAPPKGE